MSSVQAAEGLPDGWVTRRIPRPSDSKKTDLKWYSPKLGLRFLSKKDALRFVATVDGKNGDEAAAILEKMLPTSSPRPAIHMTKEAKHPEAGVSAKTAKVAADKGTAGRKRSARKFCDMGENWLLNDGDASSPENNQHMVTAKDLTIPRRRQPNRTSAINEGAAGENEEALGESFSLTQQATATSHFNSTKFTFSDASGNPVNYDENAVYLSFHHPVYERTMYEEFQKLGSKLKCGDVRANAALQRLKKGGDKKCFKLSGKSSKAFVQVDEQAALGKIKKDMGRSDHWNGKGKKSWPVGGELQISHWSDDSSDNANDSFGTSDFVSISDHPTASERDTQITGVPAEGLPDGWLVRHFPRLNQSNARTDPSYYSPKLGFKFRSRPEALRFVDEVLAAEGDEAAAIKKFCGGKKKAARSMDNTANNAAIKPTARCRKKPSLEVAAASRYELKTGKKTTKEHSHGCPRKRHSSAASSRLTSPVPSVAGVAIGEGVTFTCPKCNKDFNFPSKNGAAGSFSAHFRYCGQKKEKQRRTPQQDDDDDGVLTEGEEDPREPLPKMGTVDVDLLRAGSRIWVVAKGERWQATVLRPGIRKGVPGFVIHYDGWGKKREAWVSKPNVIGGIVEEITILEDFNFAPGSSANHARTCGQKEESERGTPQQERGDSTWKNDKLQNKSLPFAASPDTAALFDSAQYTFVDASENPVEYDDSGNAIYLSMRHPGYKSIMYEEFRKLGSKPSCGDAEANVVLQRFKDDGGNRFFKLKGPGWSKTFAEVDDMNVIAKLKHDIKTRHKTTHRWGSTGKNSLAAGFEVDRSIPENNHHAVTGNPNLMGDTQSDAMPRAVKNELAKLEINAVFSADIPPERSARRKRAPPQNLMNAQGQDLLVQDRLKQQSAAMKKRKKPSSSKTFAINENRQFEQGCAKYGWGNWALVQSLVPNRTSQECKSHAAMIETQYPNMKERLQEEYRQVWVYSDRMGPSYLPKKMSLRAALKRPTDPSSSLVD